MNVLPPEKRVAAVAALVEGNSIRSTERITGTNRNTIMRFGVTAGEGCARLHDALVRDVRASLIQADELWTFVGKKRKQVKPTDSREVGDQWVYLAMDSTAKLIISYRVGKRTAENTHHFIRDLRARVIGKPQLTTDGLVFYREAVEAAFGPDVNFAQVDKSYDTPVSPEAAGRYSPGRIIREEKKIVTGRPEWDLISTSHCERLNLSVRMASRRFTRLTSGFSKKLHNLEAAVALWVAYYNLCRVHETLRVTPAMAAGLTDHVWSIAELLDKALSAPAPTPIPQPGQQVFVLKGLSAAAAKGERRGSKIGPKPTLPKLRLIVGGRG